MIEQQKISYSELKVWNDCPYKHKLKYKDKLSPFVGNEYTAFGTAVHSLCEQRILDPSLDGEKLFKRSFEEEIEKLRISGSVLDDDLVDSMSTQVGLINELLLPAVKEYFGEYEVLSVEESLFEEIEEFDSYGKKFKGFIDLVLKTQDGKIHIIDWKTCTWGWNFKKRTDPMVTYQLTYYKNYFCRKHKVDMKNVETHFALLKRTATKENVEIFRVTSGKKKIDNSMKLLQRALINIEKGPSVKNRLSCKYCEFYKTEHCT